MTIVLDAMGSDDRPDPEVQAAVSASNQMNENIVLVGDESVLKQKLDEIEGDKSRVTNAHAPQSLDMSDHNMEARAKKQNSMRVGM